MSANRNRLTSALRRIVKTDPEVRSLLTAAESKGGKPGAAGVGSSTEAKQAQVCCDGTVGDANPGAGERDPDSGGQAGGLDSADPAKLSMGEGTLSGVTDCATGEPICFDGAGFIPPDGWDEPDDPPINPFWHPDRMYRTDRGVLYPTPQEAADNHFTLSTGYFLSCEQCFNGLNCNDPVTTVGAVTSNPAYATDPSGSYLCASKVWWVTAENTSNPDDYRASEWPADSCVNLSIAGGKIVGSKFDPENSSGDYSAPRDSIDLCSGGDQISLAPAANGGWKTINSTNDSGYLYDSSGKVIAHIDGNEYSDPAI